MRFLGVSLKNTETMGDEKFDFEKSLVFKTKYGYKVISIELDVEKIYLEVTTRCNFPIYLSLR